MKHVSILVLFFLPLNAFELKERTFKVGVAFYSTQTHELVYDPSNLNYKLSELIWVTQHAPLITLEASGRFDPRFWVRAWGKHLLASKIGVMDDYDWLNPSTSDWTHWSHHDNTPLDELYIYGVAVHSNAYKELLSLSIGYEREYKKWRAIGGTYVYSSDMGLSSTSEGFRDMVGSFEGLGITYAQEFSTLYLSAQIEQQWDRLRLSAALYYAPMVSSKDYDTHHFRAIQFDTTVSDITMTGASATLAYSYDARHTFYVGYKYLAYEETKGTTTYRDLITDDIYIYRGGAIKAQNSLIECSVAVKF